MKVSVPNPADYTVAFTTDDWKYGGWGQISHGTYPVQIDGNGAAAVSLYLPARTAMVLKEGELQKILEKPAAPETGKTK